jgi:P-type Mg2+ transporter
MVKSSGQMRVSPLLVEAAGKPVAEVLAKLRTTAAGLTESEAGERLAQHGFNEVSQEHRHGWTRRLLHALSNPLVILLSVLAVISFATQDFRAGTVMSLMVILGVSLKFLQESRADAAAARLKAMISVTATVVREGAAREVPLKELVPGDVVHLAAGDMIPADLRVLSCKDLFIIQASLTGESMPVEKLDMAQNTDGVSPIELANLCFLGTSVESGTATAVVVATGAETYFGKMAGSIVGQAAETSFDRGVNRFTWLMIRFMLVMVPIVFVLNGITKHNWHEAFFFSLAVAVGLTPEMLPMIVSVCLSKGAIAMSHKKVIVKRLNSIQNFGAMDVLCTDKTGTLTQDRVVLEQHCDVAREEDDSVLAMAYHISHFQTGLRNVLDRAILDFKNKLPIDLDLAGIKKVDEIPFDFTRRMMSVVIEDKGGNHRLLTKGSPESVFRQCNRFELQGDVYEMNSVMLFDLKEEYERLTADGFRVLAVAYKDLPACTSVSRQDELGLVLKGYVAFFDPPKDSAQPAIAALKKHGVTVKILTGDNHLVSLKVCQDVGLAVEKPVTGADIEKLSDAELVAVVEQNMLFARLSPADKQRLIKTLQAQGHVVGFLGDGINDAPALRAADVGISVDSAVDIAKESADVILLEKNLMVLEEGVLEGRKVFANILKYVRMGASSNFGNMFSVLGASVWLPFVPMAPLQILTNNLLYDFSQVAIPTDEVDEDQITKPRPWLMDEIKRFILFIGPISSIFDYTTYALMFFIFNCRTVDQAALFQTGWFVESLMTQTLIIHVIRTNKIPFLQSRASLLLMVTTLVIMGVGAYLPGSLLGSALGFKPLPHLYWPMLALTLVCYLILTQIVKTWLLRRKWI